MENNENQIEETKIMIPTEKGEREATCISLIKNEETGKQFLIYTFNEHDDNGMEIIHAAHYEEKEDSIELGEVSDQEWDQIKEFLRDMIKSEGV